MTFTIEFGWWLLPLGITIMLFAIAVLLSRSNEPDQYGAAAVLSLVIYMAAAIGSLFIWLAWALLA